MEQYIPQEEIRYIIVIGTMKKRNSIVPVIGKDTIVYKDEGRLIRRFLFKSLSYWSSEKVSSG